MLASAEAHYLRQQRLIVVGLAGARRAWAAGSVARFASLLAALQESAARDGINSVEAMLDEQNIDAPSVGFVSPRAFAGYASDGRALVSLLEQADTLQSLEVMTQTQLADASRVASGVSITARPRVQGYVRMLNPPSCPRCAVLAGRFYRWSAGFLRHPNCDCRHIPSNEDVAGDLRTDPDAMFRAGQVRGLTKAETSAIDEGADMSRVVNSRRSRYVDTAGRRLTRELRSARVGGVRLTPEQIYREAAGDRSEAVRLLERFGYITT